MTYKDALISDKFILEFKNVGLKAPEILIQLSHDDHELYKTVVTISNQKELQKIFDAVLIYDDLDDIDDEGNTVYIEDMLDSFITDHDYKDGVGFWDTPDYVRCDYSFIEKVIRGKIKQYLFDKL